MTIQEHLSQVESIRESAPYLIRDVDGVTKLQTHMRQRYAIPGQGDWSVHCNTSAQALVESLSRWLETGDYHETRTEDLV